MSHKAGVWIDHARAVIVSVTAAGVTTRTLASDVGAHPRYAGRQERGGEKKYEQRHGQQLDQYYDEVVGLLTESDELFIFGPGEAKRELEERLSRSKARAARTVDIETTGELTDPQIVAKVKEHFGIAR